MQDWELLEAYVHGSEEAFRTLVERHAGLVHSACRRQVRDPHLADDAAQAVFVLLARKAAGLKRTVVLPGWLLTVARHASLKALRASSRRRTHEQQAALETKTVHDDARDPEWAALAPYLDSGLARLGPGERDAIALRILEGLSYEETAARLGIDRNAVEKRVSRALEKLRVFLTRRGVTIGSVALASLLGDQAAAAAPPSFAADTSSLVLAAGKGAAIPDTVQAIVQEASRSKILVPGAVTALAAVLALAAFLFQSTQDNIPASPAIVAEPIVIANPPPSDPALPPDEHLLLQTGHSGRSINFSLSPDGRLLATFDMFRGQLRIWDAKARDHLLYSAAMDVSAVAFAPDGRSFATLEFRSQQALKIWSWPEGRLLDSLPVPGCHVADAFLSYVLDSHHVLAPDPDGAAIWDLTRRTAVPLDLPKPLVDPIQRTSFRHTAATALGGAAVALLVDRPDQARMPSLYDARSGKPLHACEDRHPVNASDKEQTQAELKTNGDGSQILVRRSFGREQKSLCSVTIWDAKTGNEVAHHETSAYCLDMEPLPGRQSVLFCDAERLGAIALVEAKSWGSRAGWRR